MNRRKFIRLLISAIPSTIIYQWINIRSKSLRQVPVVVPNLPPEFTILTLWRPNWDTSPAIEGIDYVKVHKKDGVVVRPKGVSW